MKTVEYKKEIEVKSNLSVYFVTENLSMNCQSWEEDKCKIEIEMEVKDNATESMKDDITFEYDEEKNNLQISTITLENKYSIRKFKMRLFVPKETTIRAKTENGALLLTELKGRQVVETENGAVKLHGIEGDIQIQTDNGAIVISDNTGNCNLKTDNGMVKIKKCNGNLKIREENGAIKLNDISGEIDIVGENGSIRVLNSYSQKTSIRNENGSIYYEFSPIENGDFRFENENGRIQLIIPDEIPFDIEARNIFGNFQVQLPGNYERKKEDGKSIITLMKDSGAVKIYAENENGSIALVDQPIQKKKFHINIPDFSTKFNSFMDWVPDEDKKEKLKKKFEKFQHKMSHFEIPDVSAIIEDTFSGMDDVINDIANSDEIKQKGNEIASILKDKIGTAMDKVQIRMDESKLTSKDRKMVDERSRLKILEMLEKKIITAEEAERLLKAMESK